MDSLTLFGSFVGIWDVETPFLRVSPEMADTINRNLPDNYQTFKLQTVEMCCVPDVVAFWKIWVLAMFTTTTIRNFIRTFLWGTRNDVLYIRLDV